MDRPSRHRADPVGAARFGRVLERPFLLLAFDAMCHESLRGTYLSRASNHLYDPGRAARAMNCWRLRVACVEFHLDKEKARERLLRA